MSEKDGQRSSEFVPLWEDASTDDLAIEPYWHFVYGTLKRGGPLNHYMEQTLAEYKGMAMIGGYEIVGLGAFPGMVVNAEDQNAFVVGELWEGRVITKSVLDWVEGSSFERALIATTEGRLVWVYLYRGYRPEGCQTSCAWNAETGRTVLESW